MVFFIVQLPEPNVYFKFHIYPLVLFYPLAAFISPVIGLLAIVIRKEPLFTIPFFMNMNAASCAMNIFISLLTLVLVKAFDETPTTNF